MFIYVNRASFSEADKRVYDYPDFLPERYSDQSGASNVAEKVVSTGSTDSTTKSTGKSMSMKNPLYVPTSKTQSINEETLNTD